MKKLVIVVLSLFGSMGVFGQTAISTDTTASKCHYVASLHAGTAGLGIDFKYNFLDHSTIRLGYSTIPFNYSTVIDLGLELKTDAKADYNNLHLLYEYQPFKSKKGIRLVAGAAYFTNAMASAKLTPNSTLTAGVTTLTAEEIGDITVTVDSKGIAPYLGLAFGKVVPNKRFNVNFDLGSYYLPAPKVTAEGTKLLANNTELGTTLNENLKDYRWMPVIQLSLNYLIK
jgi:hypothetical protein